MPVIDLDTPVQVTASRARRWPPRFLIIPVAGLALFGVAGEPASSNGTAGTPPVCVHFVTGGTVLIDAVTGKVLLHLSCPP